MFHYYVYYRVDLRREAEAIAAVDQLLFEIAAKTGVQGRLLKKRDEPALWLEVYADVPGDWLEASLAAIAQRLEFARFLQPGSTRRVECFQESI
ncbi:DUF4936 family protein [Thiobacter aerophilum]|uniref:DUF4936 family protein n=1 Tax=Thiobacter aerophilum TaxID=3121275 RepID=A0ABV0EAM7_9BURK